MNFNFSQPPTQNTPAPLRNPGQLFTPAIGATPSVSQSLQHQPTLSAAPPQPAIRQDQSRFSTVSRLVSYLPAVALTPLAPLLPMALPVLRKLPDQILSGIQRGWQSLKDTFTFQFEEKGRLGTSREAEANCGPASATMILKQFGINPPTMQQLRQKVGAPVGTGGGAFALSVRQVADAVKRTASENGRVVTTQTKTLSTNVDMTLNEMRNRLAKGEKLILLTSNLNSLSRGHYIVINEVRPDGSIVVDDPGRSKGENAVHTRAQLAKALSMRTNNYGLENALISFKA